MCICIHPSQTVVPHFTDGCGYVEDGREIFDDEQDGNDTADSATAKGNTRESATLKNLLVS